MMNKPIITTALLLLAILWYSSVVFAFMPQKADTAQVLREINNAKGKVVIVNFWATYCPPCRVEIPELMKVREAYSVAELFVIGISVDKSSNQFPDFFKGIQPNYPIYWASPEVAGLFGVKEIPKILIYDQQGGQAYKHDGFIQSKELIKQIDTLLGK